MQIGGHSQIRKISTSHKWLNAGVKSENVYVCRKGKIRTNMDINQVVEINNPTKNTQQKELRNSGKDFVQKTVPISRSIVLQGWKISYMSSILSTHLVFKYCSQYYHFAISAPFSIHFQRQNPHYVLTYYIFTKSIPPLDMYNCSALSDLFLLISYYANLQTVL